MEVIKTIGSDPSNDIVLKHADIAESHARLIMRGQHFMEIEDLGSKKGVFVNNKRINGKLRLRPGDIVSFGNHIFEFEAYYPPFLGEKPLVYEEAEQAVSGAEVMEDVLQTEEIGTESPSSFVQRLLQALQVPKDRQKVQRIWFLAISSLMLLTFVLPYLSWGNQPGFNFFFEQKKEPLSGIMYFLEIFDIEAKGGSIMEIVSVGIMLLTVLGTAIFTIFFFLYGLNLWRPRKTAVLGQLAFVQVGFFGLVFLKEFFRYVAMWMNAKGAETYVELMTSRKSESYLLIENLGIGFWICLIGAILLFRSTRNKLWQQGFSRKWSSLSVTFWVPIVILLCFVHQGVGLIETNIDKDSYNKLFPPSMGGSSIGIKETRICQTAPSLVAIAYIIVLEDIQASDSDDNRVPPEMEGLEKRRDKEVMHFYYLWMTLHLFLMLIFFQMFYRKIHGNTRLISAGLTVVMSGILLWVIGSMLGLREGVGGDDIFSVSVGYGVYVAIWGGLGMLAEQLYFYSEASKRQSVEAAPIDDLSEEGVS